MKKFLTSILAIGFAMPAMANITASSTCDTDALGQSNNGSTANVEAIWNAISYTCPAGQYLEADNVTCTTCPSGSYCGGFTNTPFADSDIGVNGCPSGYTNSAAGTTSQNDCYATGTATCSTRNPYSGANPTKTSNIVYGNSTNGSASCKTYYGDQTTCVLDTANACEITDITCATGYRKERVAVAGVSNPLASVNLATDGDHRYGKGYYNNGDYCYADGSSTSCDAAPFTSMDRYDWQTEFSYGTVKGIASCNTTINPTMAVVMQNIDALTDGEMTPQQFMAAVAAVSSQEDTAIVQDILTRYSSGTITFEDAHGELLENFGKADPSAFNTSSEGQYCWCQTESFTPTNGSTVAASSSWVFNLDYGSASNCASRCANDCANGVRNAREFRGALFGSLGAYELQCVANSININWYNENELHESNQCTYDGTITLPSTNPTKVGYTFSGWKLRTTNN